MCAHQANLQVNNIGLTTHLPVWHQLEYQQEEEDNHVFNAMRLKLSTQPIAQRYWGPLKQYVRIFSVKLTLNPFAVTGCRTNTDPSNNKVQVLLLKEN
jgi:hypothetical protein